MLDHIGVNVSDFDSACNFYAAALAPLGYRLALQPAPNFAGFATADGRAFPLWVSQGRGEITKAHIAFTAPDRATVDAFHKAALDAGGTDNGSPGIRELYHPTYYGAYVLTADGVNLEAVCHSPEG